MAAELINAALTRHERWHEGLEEASRLYFSSSSSTGGLDVTARAARQAGVAVLLRLHRELGGTGAEGEEGGLGASVSSSSASVAGGEEEEATRSHLAFSHGCVRVVWCGVVSVSCFLFAFEQLDQPPGT